MSSTLEGRWMGPEVRCPVCGDELEVKIITEIKDIVGRRTGGAGVAGNTPVVAVDISPGKYVGEIQHICETVERSDGLDG